MTALQRSEINQLADTLRETLGLGIPLDVEEAVRRLGGTLHEVEELEEKMEARVLKRGERFQIELANGRPATRKRFSVAHEIGHLMLHMGYLMDPDRWSSTGDYQDSVYYRYGYSTEEREADEFAAAFLMPRGLFFEAVQRHTRAGNCDTAAIAEEFKTSRDAVMRRGRMLGIFDVGSVSA